MPWTFNTPQPVATAISIKIIGMALDQQGNGHINFASFDANGAEIANSQGYANVPPSEVTALWPNGPNSAQLYSFLAAQLGWAAGAATVG